MLWDIRRENTEIGRLKGQDLVLVLLVLEQIFLHMLQKASRCASICMLSSQEAGLL